MPTRGSKRGPLCMIRSKHPQVVEETSVCAAAEEPQVLVESYGGVLMPARRLWTDRDGPCDHAKCNGKKACEV